MAYFLLNFYDKIYLLVKKHYYKYNKSLFLDNPNLIIVPIDYEHDDTVVDRFVETIDSNIDIISSLGYKRFMRISNKKFLNYKAIDNTKYSLELDTINNNNFDFILSIYNDVNLNLSHYFDYFHIPDSQESLNLYNSIKNYYIIFIQLKCSNEKKLNIDNLINKYINDPNVILICSSENLYDLNNNEIKYNLAQQFILNDLVYYNDTIKNCNEMYMIDSCFSTIILVYSKTNKLKATNVRLIARNLVNNFIF